MRMSEPVVLELRRVDVAYRDRQVLRGVDLSVQAGEVVGLVGPNGCGKTTLIKAVTQVIRCQGGEVRLNGRLASSLTRRELARLASVVPQNAPLPAGYSALDVVLMGRTPHLRFLQQDGADDRRQAREALTTVGARHLADRRVDQVSGGERQMIALARALAQNTPLLLLDEPTASLDIAHQIAVFQLLRDLAHAEHFTVLVTVHDLVLASLYCDRVALMQEGRVVFAGLSADVLTTEHVAQTYGVRALVLSPSEVRRPIVLPVLAGSGIDAANGDGS